MAGYKELDFNERRAASQKARENALAKLKARPPVDEAELARRREAQDARDAAQAEKRRAKKEAQLLAQAQKSVEAREAKVETATPSAAQPTEEERKAARDAKYAKRKSKAKR